jgi:hypothetical protein
VPKGVYERPLCNPAWGTLPEDAGEIIWCTGELGRLVDQAVTLCRLPRGDVLQLAVVHGLHHLIER